MKKILLFLSMGLLIIAAVVFFATKKSDLYHQEMSVKAKEGKDFIMSLEEVERQKTFSIIKVKHTSGASVPSAVFIVKGCYEIAKIRGAGYFINLKEWEDDRGNWLYKIGFSSNPNVNPKEYFGDDIDLSKDLEFMSVQSYDLLWGKK